MRCYVRSLVIVGSCGAAAYGLTDSAWAKPESEPAQKVVYEDVVIDAVVAAVDDKPITLSELNDRFIPPRKLSLAQAAKDPDAQKLLDAMILERVLEEEAAAKRLSVSDTEVEEYVDEVAKRNNLSRADFEHELVSEGGNLLVYKRQVRLDILRTKLAANFGHNGITVSDEEIDTYVSEHPEYSRSDNSLKLRQIQITKQNRTPEAVQERLQLVVKALDSGTSFGDVAKQYSDGPHAPEGGLIGIVGIADLSKDVVDAVEDLKSGERSKPIESETDIQIFLVEQRFSKGDDDKMSEALRDEIRKTMAQQKTQNKLSTFFVNELYKNHAVEKKI